jgi:hypothetical protein
MTINIDFQLARVENKRKQRRVTIMPFLNGDVAVKQIGDDRWQLLQPVVYKGKEQLFTVPVDFQTDFASVPGVFVWLIPRYGRYTKAAILHDFLCDTKPINRSDADGLFRRAMRELEVPFLRRWLMWAAVRIGAGLSDASWSEVGIWLLVAVPAIIFLLVPAIVLLAWMAMFWLIEWAAYSVIKPFSRKRMNRPKFRGL